MSGSSDRGSACKRRDPVSTPNHRIRGDLISRWDQQTQSQKFTWSRSFVEVHPRRFPLVARHEIEVAVSVDIRGGDGPGNLGIANSDTLGHIIKPAVTRPYEQRIGVAPAEIIPRGELMPTVGVAQQLVIPHGDLMKLRPAIRAAAHKSRSLDRFEFSIIVEVH